ncbi:MAG TPA: methylmalonyl Co-A mutase-associated GTPase MeaB, partial [Acidimicrobiales bacterium]|nr:methylmalonyl Co-A mutase-associated GTPase MeaB [Acidimicrobiales bacterium]
DLFVINKADRPGARETTRDLELMLELSPPRDWRPPIISTVAQNGDGTDELWAAIADHRRHLVERGQLDVLRRRRLVRELRQIAAARVAARVDDAVAADGAAIVDAVAGGELDPYEAADRILDELWTDGPPSDGP